ncbi:hypothetical protein [Dyella japonica]|uniref:Uncharacterized protein n=1 Tax=Dyella japonica TaxID=231455 RepID=A0ABV2K0U7_9GAMM
MTEQALMVSMETLPDGVEGLVKRAELIQEAVSRVMTEGVHYDVIPNTTNKALLQKGAHKLALLFRFTWRFELQALPLWGEHREVRAKCILLYQGQPVAEKEALCTTLETKYRYRSENTGAEVPRDYWTRGKPAELLGGEDFMPRKCDGRWLIFHQVPYRNVPDHYNTVHQMAQKRAFVSVILAATAASDAFDPEPGDDDSIARTTHKQRQARRAPLDPRAESSDRKQGLMADLEEAALQNDVALLEAWQALSEADRVLVGKDFGTLMQRAKAMS